MKLLEKLTATPGIAGREHRVRDLILKETRTLFDEVRVDPLGSVIGVTAVIFGATLGASLCFLISRYFARDAGVYQSFDRYH